MRSELRLALLGVSSLLVLACGSFGKTGDDDDDDDDWFDGDTSADSGDCADADPLDENCDGEVDCDEDPSQAGCDETGTNPGEDTGVGLWYYVGSVGSADARSLDVGIYGYGVYGVASEDWVCTDLVTYTESGRAPEGCPECDWSFAVTPGSSQADGAYCSDFGFSDGDLSSMAWWAGSSTSGLGFAENYVFQGTNADYDFTNTLFFYYDGGGYTGWYWTAYNLPAYSVYSVYGDATYAEIFKPVMVGSGGSYYQYYTYYWL